jgi:hypothetical protein
MPKNYRLIIITSILFLALFLLIDLVLGSFLIPRNYREFRTADPWYHHGLKRNVSAMAAWGPIIYPIHTNSMGFRDTRVRMVPLSSENRRILILGDSHSEGVGVDYRYTFAGRLQETGESIGVEVLNASAVSYSPRIHYLKTYELLKRQKLEVDEIWIVIDISDLQNEIAYRDFIPRKRSSTRMFRYRFRQLARNSSFTLYSLHSIKDNRDYMAFRETLMEFEAKTTQMPTRNAIEMYRDFFRTFNDAELLRDPGFHGVSEWIYDRSLRELADEGLELGFGYISKLNTICRQKDIKVRLSIHPWQTQILRGDTTDYYVERWREFCLSEDIGFINLYPLFINHENPLWVARTCYIEGDNHWNEMGHARVADYLARFLNQ